MTGYKETSKYENLYYIEIFKKNKTYENQIENMIEKLRNIAWTNKRKWRVRAVEKS